MADKRAEIERLTDEKRRLELAVASEAAADARARALAARSGSMGALVQGLAAQAPIAPAAVPARFELPVQGLVSRRFGEADPERGRSRGLDLALAARRRRC